MAADLQRAYEAWQGENYVFGVAGLQGPVRRWASPDGRALAFRAALDENFSIFHVAANGAMFGASHSCVLRNEEGAVSAYSEITPVPEGPAQELLDAWLNLPHSPDLRFSTSLRATMGAYSLPLFDNCGELVGLAAQPLRRAPGPSYVTVRDSDGDPLWMIPTGPDCPPSVFPDAEGMMRDYGSLDGGVIRPSQAGFKDPAHPVDVRITGPLSFLFPVWVGLDALFNWVKMAAMVQAGETEGALERSRTLAAPYLSEGTSTWALTWFWPTVRQVGLETAICRAEEFGLNDARSLEDMYRSPHWQRKMAEPVPVVRAYGPIGLLWALLLDRLSERRVYDTCAACGRVLPARRGKRRRYCTEMENRECFDQRQRARQRHSRARNRPFSAPDSGPAW